MSFIKYQHVERFTEMGENNCDGLFDGPVHVFPKLDGANHCVWWDDERQEVCCASRNKILTKESDGTGFWKWMVAHPEIIQFCKDFKDYGLRVYGEFLTPHTIKDYEHDAWNRFYVFDVTMETCSCGEDGCEKGYEYLSYGEYKLYLDKYGIPCIPPLYIGEIKGDSAKEQLMELMDGNHYLMKDNGIGEGIVIKRYDWNPPFPIQWRKLVRAEFKAKFYQNVTEPNAERDIINDTPDEWFGKEWCKWKDEHGEWSDRQIPDLMKYAWAEWWKDFSFQTIGTSRLTIDITELKKHFSKALISYIRK